MTAYQYVAKDGTGKKFTGLYTEVNNIAALRKELAKIGCVLVRARRKKGSAAKRRRIKRSEVATFAYKFAGMYSAGLSIVSCLETLEEQTENQAFKDVIADIKQSIQTGSSLKNACEKYKNLFSGFFLGMIEAGEASGKLGKTLDISAAYLEKQAEIKRKVTSAFAYPVIVAIMCFVVIGFLLIFVIPIFMKLYKQAHVLLPLPTRILVGVSSMITQQWWAVIIVIVAGVITGRWLLKKPQAQVWWDSFKLNMPVFAKLNRMLVVSHFTRTFAMLASVGVPLIKALEVASMVAHNHKLTEIAEELQQEVKAGNAIAKSLKSYAIFPPIIVQLAASGEQVGQLPEMLNKGTDILDKDIDRTINALLIKLEPALTIIMGLIVGLILIGAYLPMFDYMGHLQ
ncbi:MAG: type II secretion system F family protein [Phycisphaerae bacterium]|nr:type II secretion system F family protein [Phycisphaerae bacterium]